MMQNAASSAKPHTDRPCKDPSAGPMGDAERGPAYRKRKKFAASKTICAAKLSVSQLIQARTDAELQEALRQALVETRRYPPASLSKSEPLRSWPSLPRDTPLAEFFPLPSIVCADLHSGDAAGLLYDLAKAGQNIDLNESH